MGGNFLLVFGSPVFAEIGLYTYFVQSNLAGKVIVLLLVVFSLVAWAVMLGKYSDLKEIAKLNKFTEKKIASSGGVFGAVATQRGLKGPYAVLLSEAAKAWGGAAQQDLSSEVLAARMGRVENAIARVVAKQSMKYESKMVLLSSIVSGAPFLGLLGTVWGVMDSFAALGQQASATLQALAPGVSGALLTTVAGLIVAIPSVFGYNFLLTMSRQMVLDLESFASLVYDQIELETREKYLAGAPKPTIPPLESEKFAGAGEPSRRITFNPDAVQE